MLLQISHSLSSNFHIKYDMEIAAQTMADLEKHYEATERFLRSLPGDYKIYKGEFI